MTTDKRTDSAPEPLDYATPPRLRRPTWLASVVLLVVGLTWLALDIALPWFHASIFKARTYVQRFDIFECANLAEAIESTNPKRAITEYETYLALVEGIPEEADRIALVQQRVKALKGK